MSQDLFPQQPAPDSVMTTEDALVVGKYIFRRGFDSNDRELVVMAPVERPPGYFTLDKTTARTMADWLMSYAESK